MDLYIIFDHGLLRGGLPFHVGSTMISLPESFNFKRTWGPTPKYDRVLAYSKPSTFKIIAGPCSVESKEQIHTIAKFVASQGATHLRGGVFRAGTYPSKNFGYVDEMLLHQYQLAARVNGLKNIIEILDYSDDALKNVLSYADCVQVGCRQMQNYTLLKILAKTGKPIFLKRHPGSTMDEFLGSAEHILAANEHCDLTLIERGSSNHENHVRWSLSITMIAAIKQITKIPIICDASHGTGRRDLVQPMALAGVAAGADGVLIETHTDPDNSLSDKEQAISFDVFSETISKINKIRGVLA